jgi:carboxypeptidase C (cathepsin A)
MAEDESTSDDGSTGSTGHAKDAEEPRDDLVRTEHVLTLPDRRLEYTATAGRVVLREESSGDKGYEGAKPRAQVFVVSYVAHVDGAPDPARPVTFAFNGGPGSSSTWLHLGLLGPRLVDAGDVGALTPPPYGLRDNPESLLAHSDLVFIDPVTTGFSRAVEGGKAETFHGYTGDLESVGEVIRAWVSAHGRWLSPKYVVGESYGTLRAAGLADHLQSRHGLYLNGLVLVSPVLDMATIRFTEGNDLPHALFVPTYAAIAWYHGRHAGRSLADVVADARVLAERDLPWALARGTRLEPADRARIVRRLADLVGLTPEHVERADLRLEHLAFFRELLRDRRLAVGRLDGRFTGPEADGVGATVTADPSMSAVVGPYAAAVNHHLRTDLAYASDLPYDVLTSRVQPWSYAEFEGRGVSTADALARAMRANPHLRVQVACGWFDGATPFAAAEHTLAHLAVPDALRANIEVRHYDAGHMTYVHEPSRLAQSEHIADFVRASRA